MSTFESTIMLDEKQFNFLEPLDNVNQHQADEIARLKFQLDVLKNGNPLLIAEMALELQVERLRAAEAMKARDTVLNRLTDAYISIRQKNEIIERMQDERESKGAPPFATHLIRVRDTVEDEKLKAHISTLEATIEQMRSEVAKPIDPPPCYEENIQKKSLSDASIQTDPEDPVTKSLNVALGEVQYVPPVTDDAVELVKARNDVLATIPLPDNPPDATLTAIVIPPPVTLHEFLSLAPTSLKNALSTYRILHNNTTTWCPDREEHGFMYVPMFKCSTNPKVPAAHRWSAVDPVGRLAKPTECFYHKEGIWYYAGLYKGFKMDILSTKEWSQLPSETTSVIIKETIAARKSSTPQNTYETSQLYSSGALKVACVGLQCVGFNQEVYKAILEHSAKLTETKWKSLTALVSASTSTSSPVTGSGSDSATSTASAHAKGVKPPRLAQRGYVTAPPPTPIITQGVAQTTPTINAIGVAPSPVLPLGSAKPSIWNINASGNNLSPSLAGPSGNLSGFISSSSPLSAASKVFESSRTLPNTQKDVFSKA